MEAPSSGSHVMSMEHDASMPWLCSAADRSLRGASHIPEKRNSNSLQSREIWVLYLTIFKAETGTMQLLKILHRITVYYT